VRVDIMTTKDGLTPRLDEVEIYARRIQSTSPAPAPGARARSGARRSERLAHTLSTRKTNTRVGAQTRRR
jgi:hypothetical protein